MWKREKKKNADEERGRKVAVFMFVNRYLYILPFLAYQKKKVQSQKRERNRERDN